jgi:putative ABC transport system permease protein
MLLLQIGNNYSEYRFAERAIRMIQNNRPSPPRFFLRFFRWFCHPALKDSIEGDLMEFYYERCNASGKRKADLNFIVDVVLLCRPGIIKPSQPHHTINHYGMLKNYCKVSIRNIRKYKTFSFINIFGLSVAMSVCMLVMLMLADQRSYDQFHEKKEHIYRILSDYENSRQPYATSPFPLATALKSEYTIAEETTNLTPGVGGDITYDQQLTQAAGYFADPGFFRVFSFELEEGNKYTALEAPNSVVISKALAHQLFRDANPIGKIVEFADRKLPFPVEHIGGGEAAVSWGSFTVTGVIDIDKYRSHLKFDILMSASTQTQLYTDKRVEDFSNNWEWYFRTYTYALLASDKTEDDLTLALNDLVARKYANIKAEHTKGFKLQPQKLADIQLGLRNNDTNNRMPVQGYYFLGILALVIMISACLNYTNLSIARALTRAKEIGVRKVTGANKKSLVVQFLSESVITSLLALAMALVLLLFVKRAFKGLWINKHLKFDLPDSVEVYIGFIVFALLTGLLAGIYPAFHLSRYEPAHVLKNIGSIGIGKLGMRKVLSVSQFVISLFFITTSILIFNQFKYFLEFDYGFTSANIVNIDLQGNDYRKLANEWSSIPGVGTISATNIVPATGQNDNIQIRRSGDQGDYLEAGILHTDENFTDNLGLKVIAGKGLPEPTDSSGRYIVVNEQMIHALGYKHPAEIIGQVLENKWRDEAMTVVGVVEDFRYKLLINAHDIGPLVMRNQQDYKYANVKIVSADLMGTIAKMESRWKQLDPTHPMSYEFFDDQLATTHQGIFDIVAILGFIAFLSVIIACLGMLGMATYTAERKKKEVGIRKVLGAENFRIAYLLSREFLKVLAIAIVIGAPLSYMVNNLWLQKFPNRVEFGFGTVFIGTVILLMLGLLTIGSQTIRASRTNPVESLRND